MNKRQKKNDSEDPRPVTRPINLENVSNNSLIPVELIVMIFGKLELKSIARCRCVSKGWASILRSSYFTELILNRSRTSSPKLLFAFKKDGELIVFTSPQPQNADDNWSQVISNYQLKFTFSGSIQEIDYVYGLICLKELQIIKGKNVMLFKICNPSTGQVLILPKVKTKRYYNVRTVFGYDPVGKQFKVLAMTKGNKHGGLYDEYQVLTLGSGNMSWKMIDFIPHNPPDKKICVNGVIYYTHFHCFRWDSFIVCFDVSSEKLSSIKPTGMIDFLNTNGLIMLWGPTISLINYNDKLGLLLCEKGLHSLFVDGRSIIFKLWVLEDLKKEVWSEHTFLFPTVPENIIEDVRLDIVGVTQTNEIVLSPMNKHYPVCLFYLNLEKKTIVKVAFQGMDESKFACVTDHTFLHHVEDVKLYGNV